MSAQTPDSIRSLFADVIASIGVRDEDRPRQIVISDAVDTDAEVARIQGRFSVPLEHVRTLHVAAVVAGERFGLDVDADASPEQTALHLAAELQGWLAEQRGYWGAALPACPRHAHPMSPRLVEGHAMWTCPDGVDELNRPVKVLR